MAEFLWLLRTIAEGAALGCVGLLACLLLALFCPGYERVRPELEP